MGTCIVWNFLETVTSKKVPHYARAHLTDNPLSVISQKRSVLSLKCQVQVQVVLALMHYLLSVRKKGSLYEECLNLIPGYALRIFASVTAEEKEGEGGRRRKRRRGRKKERERRKRRKEEGRRGGGPFSNPLSLLNMCVKSCASFSVNTRCRCYCFPRGTSLLHFLLPAFALLQLPATAASHAPTSSPTRTSIASFNTTFRLLLPPHLCYLVLSISVSLEVSIPIHWVISDI